MRLLIIDEMWKKNRGVDNDSLVDHMSMDYIIEDCGGGFFKALKDRSGLLPMTRHFTLDTLLIALKRNKGTIKA